MHASVVAGAALLRAASSSASVGHPGRSVAIFLVYVVYTNIARVPDCASASLALSDFVTAPSGVVQANSMMSHVPPPPPAVVGATHEARRNSVMTSSGMVSEGTALADGAVEPLADASLEPLAEADSLLAAGDALEESALEVEEQPVRTVVRPMAAMTAARVSVEFIGTPYASVR